MRKVRTPNTKCRICGQEFYAPSSLLKEGWGKYCSRQCQHKGFRTGIFVVCAYCGQKVYRTPSQLNKASKTNLYFCNRSCHCAWKNKHRRKKVKTNLAKVLWGSWCNGSTTRCGRVSEDSNSSGPPRKRSFLLRFKKKKSRPLPQKRPSKRVLYELYWKQRRGQTEIAEIFNASHTSVKRWLRHYRILVKPRTLSCGRHPNTLKNLELGKTPEVEKRSAQSRIIYSKEKLIEKIREFVEKEGRIPTKDDFSGNPSYPNHTTYRDYFDTWNNAIKAAGYKPNKPWFYPGTLHAKDGHPCNSLPELIIDNWLLENNIPHERERLYPKSRYRCDFVIDGIFVEFFGLVDAIKIRQDYRALVEKKRKLCRKHGIPLIELFEKDISYLDKTLGKKLERIKRKNTVTKLLRGYFYKFQTKTFEAD